MTWFNTHLYFTTHVTSTFSCSLFTYVIYHHHHQQHLSLIMSPTTLAGKYLRKSASTIHSLISFIVFLFLDFLDSLFCIAYSFLDEFFEGDASSCYCHGRVQGRDELSGSLYGRRNVFRKMGFLSFPRKSEVCNETCGGGGTFVRWSDCGCESCVSWMKDDAEMTLHVVVQDPSREANKDLARDPTENVILIHGFLSSSAFWTETVFPNLSEDVKLKYRLFAVDLLGFGESPKPRNCLYTLKDHLEMIEKSVISPYKLKSFHLVAHSMGCIVATALAANYSNSVKSVTLIAPPYFPGSQEGASLIALQKLAEKKLWPPLLFGSSFMSWYEHLGRCVCLVLCRNHRIWERILKLVTWRRDLHFMFRDLTRHTHHSAWHSMHNVICGGARFMDDFLEILTKCRVRIYVIQGDRDVVVPLECSYNIKKKVPDAEVCVISGTDHSSVVIGREKQFTESLEHIWTSMASTGHCKDE